VICAGVDRLLIGSVSQKVSHFPVSFMV